MVKTKSKIIILISILSVIVLGLGAWGISVLVHHISYNKAKEDMDINDKDSVIRVLEFAKGDTEVLTGIASQYIESGDTVSAAQILLHLLQTDGDSTENTKSLLKQCGFDDTRLSGAKIVDTEFEIMDELDGVAYGGVNGVYCADFNGLIRYKLSSIRPISMYATTGGVYILDSADNCIKLLSRDGLTVKTIKKNVREFIYYGSFIYSIGLDGTISGMTETTLAEGEEARGLRIENEYVLCDVYDKEYDLIRTITLNE